MDIRMPGLDGIAATRLIIQNKPRQVIVGISGFKDEEMTQTCLSVGMKRVIGKPFREIDFKTVLFAFGSPDAEIEFDPSLLDCFGGNLN
jgi:CheY-like chemotaxis protein